MIDVYLISLHCYALINFDLQIRETLNWNQRKKHGAKELRRGVRIPGPKLSPSKSMHRCLLNMN